MTLALVPLLATLGPLAVLLLVAIVFVETGLLLGFFLPGDSILFAAGVLVASGAIPVPLALVLLATGLAAVAGDQVSYLIGRRFGPGLFTRRSRLLSPKHVDAAREFFDRHGHKAVMLARFVPLARTFTPVVAGAVGMPRRRFTAYNLVGGLAWTSSMLVGGFFLGGVPLVAAHVELFTLGLVIVSMVPAALALGRRWPRRRRSARQAGPERVVRPPSYVGQPSA